MGEPRDDAVDSTAEPGGGPPEGMPRWVKVSLIVVAVLVALFVIVNLTGAGGEHGPGRHGASGMPSVVPTAAASSIDARF